MSVNQAVVVFNERAAREGGNGMTRSLAQMKLLSEANALGYTFVSESESKTRYYRRGVVEALATQPVWTKQDIVHLGARGQLPGPAALVLRQRSRAEIDPADQDVVDAQGTVVYHRAWYGYDRLMDLSEDPADRRAQDLASKELWPVAPAFAGLVDEIEQQGQCIPMIVSVGGLIVS